MIPSATQLEICTDQILALPEQVRKEQLAELTEFGSVRAQAIGATGLSTDFEVGYELGIQAGRVVLAQSVELIEKGIDASTLL